MASDPNTSRPPVLQIVRDGQPRSFPLTGRITFGRGEEADIRLDDHRVSRIHCRVEPIPGEGVKLTDLGSSNGTMVNGREISQVVLRLGDVGEVGGTRLTVEDVGVAGASGGSAAPPPVPSARVSAAPPVPTAGRPSGTPPPPPARRAPTTPPVPTPAAPAPAGPAAPAADGGPRKRRQVRELPSTPAPAAPAPTASNRAATAATAALTPPSPEPVLAAAAAAPASLPSRTTTARSNASYLPMILLGAGVIAMLAIVLTLGGEDAEAIANSMERKATALEESGEISSALGQLKDLVSRYPDTAAGGRAPEAIERLEARLQQRREGVSRMGAVLTDNLIGSYGAMEQRLREVGRRYAPGVTSEDVAEKIAEAERMFAERSVRYVSGIRTEAIALMQARAYGKALDLVGAAEASGRVHGEASKQLRLVRERVERQARQQFGALLRKVQALPARKALDELNLAAARFEGTKHAGELRARTSLLAADVERAEDAIVVVEDKPEERPAAPPKEDLLRALARAEGFVGRRAYAAAVPAFEEALRHAPSSDRKRLEARIAEVRAMADVVDAIIARVKDQPGAFRRFKLGSTMTGRVTAATREKVTLTLPGATVYWHWARLTPDRFRRLVIRAGLEGRVSVEAAAVLLDMQAPELALGVLARRFDKEVNLRPRVQELAARARGFAEVPVGGFRVRDGKLLTTEEYDEAVLVAKLDRHEKGVRDAAPSRWQQDADALRGLGGRGEERLAAALMARLDGFQSRLESVPALSKKRVGALRQKLLADLKVARSHALSLIFDTKKYPYPYAPNQKEIQAEVDSRVQKCADIWETPGRKLVEDDAELSALLQDANAVTTALEALGRKVDGPEKLLKLIDDRIDMRHYDGGAGIVEHWKSVIEHNDALLESGAMTQPERDCYTATNRYRVMMGLRAVMGDPALIQCARGHSQEMKDLGYFSHTSPTAGRRSPGARAKLAGWGGSVSENIARGRSSGFDVVRQWCGSSGHHRNILGKGWTHLGAGKAKDGAFWTQNFGKGRSKPPRKK